MSRDFDKAQEMVWASMEYVKVLGFRLRRTEGQRDDWKKVAQSHSDDLIACRQQLDALKAERNALRSTTIDTATGHLLDAFGSLANEPRHGSPDDEYRDRIVTKIHTIKLERDALKKERDDLWQREGIEKKRRIDVEEHFSDTISSLAALLGIDGGERSVTVAIEKLKAERDAAKQEAASARQDAVTRAEADRKRIDGLMIQVQDMRAEIERLKKPARQHPVKAGEWVWVHEHRRANQVQEVHADWYWLSTCDSCRFDRCTPFDPPEATHDTPAGKDAAESAVKREPKPGDTVRLGATSETAR